MNVRSDWSLKLRRHIRWIFYQRRALLWAILLSLCQVELTRVWCDRGRWRIRADVRLWVSINGGAKNGWWCLHLRQHVCNRRKFLLPTFNSPLNGRTFVSSIENWARGVGGRSLRKPALELARERVSPLGFKSHSRLESINLADL